jgi:hypothetical protein
MSTATAFDPTAALEKVNADIDLGAVRAKLADPSEGPGHDPAQLDLMESEYRKFLALRLLHPDTEIVPCQLADEMWHQHILDTAAYREDCQTLFGEFLDHYPYFGMNGPADAQALRDAYAETLELYQAAFGAAPESAWLVSDAARCKRPHCRWGEE